MVLHPHTNTSAIAPSFHCDKYSEYLCDDTGVTISNKLFLT